MKRIDVLRDAIDKRTHQEAGSLKSVTKVWGAKRMTPAELVEYLKRPVQPAQAAQVLDPDDPDFGKRYFVAGVDVVGDPNHPLR